MPRTCLFLVATAVLTAAGIGVYAWNAQRTPSAASIPHAETRTEQPKPPLDLVVAKLVKEGPTTPYLKLNYVIKELSTDLAQHDVDALIAFIMGAKPELFSDGEWGSLTNDIQEALSVQTVPNEKVATALIDTYRDTSRIQLMRDYALQHIGGFAIYLVHTRSTSSDTLPPFFDKLVDELKSATADPTKPWAGTAFNLLDGLVRAAEYRGTEVPGLDLKEFTHKAVEVTANAQYPLNARLPALQVASRRNAPEATNLARQILSDPNANVMLVQSAAAVLAEHGTKDDLPILQGLLATNRPHTQAAIRSALQRLQNL